MDSRSDGPAAALTPDTLLLLNRATLVMHTVRTAIHEVNNVLQMISGSAEMLSGAPGLQPQAAARIDTILRNALRGHAILQSVSDIARRDRAGERALDVPRLAAQALEMRRYEHTRSGITALVEQQGAASPRVVMDPQHLLQILLNLVINAEQALAEAPTRELRVSIAAMGEGVEIRVTDSGPGVRAGDPLFEPLKSGRPETSAGLGLAASRLIVAQYGGSLDAQQTSSGAAFLVKLPAIAVT
jgi:C4-dicarboxylate-specific signal transduction histidine kinase